MRFAVKSQKGFSLVELMIVVGIIGILAALAVPRFTAFQAKARQAEAKTNLTQIYTLQESYALDNNTYIAVAAHGADTASPTASSCPANAIGFTIQPCASARYQYATTAVAAATFTARAISGTAANNRVVPGCATADTHTIDNTKNLLVTSNAATLCN